jgi:hypothetical protein
MTKWLLAQLNNGKVDDTQILSARSIQAIRKPSSILGINPRDQQETHFYLYGLGLMINDRDGKLVYAHGGAVNGFLSQVMFIPEEKLGIVVLTNTDQNNFYNDLANEIRDAFLSLPYKGFSYTSLKSSREERRSRDQNLDSLRKIVRLNNKLSLPIEAYAGEYQNEVYGKIWVRAEGGHLNIYFAHHPDLIGRLEHIQNDNFLCTYSQSIIGIEEIPFNIADNKVTGLKLRVDAFLEFTPYAFIKTSD